MKKSDLLDVLAFITEISYAGPGEVCQQSENGLYLFFNKDKNSFSDDFGIFRGRNLCVTAVGTEMSEAQIERISKAFDMRLDYEHSLDVPEETYNIGRKYKNYVFADSAKRD